MTRKQIADFISKEYQVKPEFLWKEFPDYEDFRHSGNKKWLAHIMNVKKDKIGLEGKEQIDILDVKADTAQINPLLKNKGFFRAYHMNKENWISLYTAQIPDNRIESLISESYKLTENYD